MHRRLQLLVVIAASLSLLTACAGGLSPELKALGSTVTPVNINFGDLHAYATRSKTAYASEAVIRSKYPATTRIVRHQINMDS